MTTIRLIRIFLLTAIAALCWGCMAESQHARSFPPPAGIKAEDTCTGKPEMSTCWMEVANQKGCYIWNSALGAEETVTWTGVCGEGLAQGTGTQTWNWGSGKENQSADVGMLVDGKRHGNWVIREGNGDVQEGPYVDGKRNGHWIINRANGEISEGAMVNDEMYGEWVTRQSDGKVIEKRIY